MKIVLAGPVHPKLKQTNSREFPHWQPQASWVRALRQLGHHIDIFFYTRPTLYSGLRRMSNKFPSFSPEFILRNKNLIRLVKNIQPDMFFFSAGTKIISPRTLRLIKAANIPIVIFNGTSPRSFLSDYEKTHIPFATLIVVNDPAHVKQWRELGAENVVSLPISAADPLLHRRGPGVKKYSSDVCFVGTLTQERQKTLTQILSAKFTLRVWGLLLPGDTLAAELRPIYQGEAWGEKVVKIYHSAKIALNLVDSSMPTGGNLRTFEIPGCGTFQLASVVNPHWFTPGKEIAVFQSRQDLLKKLQYYLKHERRRRAIAQAGFQKTHRLHTYEQRFTKLFTLLQQPSQKTR